MSKKDLTTNSLYQDALKAAARVLSEVYGKPPKQSTVKAVAKQLVAAIPASRPDSHAIDRAKRDDSSVRSGNVANDHLQAVG